MRECDFAQDKLVCASSELAPYTNAMARLYESTRADLSEEGRRLVDERQRSWLAYMHIVCPADARCLESAYGDGLDWLEWVDMTALSSDYFCFLAVGRYEAHAVDGGPRLIRRIVVLPRIDDPITPETSRWNRLVAQLSRRSMAGARGDQKLGCTVRLASGRQLEAADLFGGKRPWKAFLAQQVYAALQRTVTRNGVATAIPDPAMRQSSPRPRRGR